MRQWRRGKLQLEQDELVFATVKNGSIDRFSVITTRVFHAADYADKARFVLSLVSPDSNVLVEFDTGDDMNEWQEKIRVVKREFQVNEMRKSVANVADTIESKLRPMIIQRQSIIEKALSESDTLVESSQRFEVRLDISLVRKKLILTANSTKCQTQKVFTHVLAVSAICISTQNFDQ